MDYRHQTSIASAIDTDNQNFRRLDNKDTQDANLEEERQSAAIDLFVDEDSKVVFGSTCEEHTIAHYFETLNSGDFQTTASLFSEDGILYPPFESKIVGPEAIASYLNKEARGLQLFPKQIVREELSSDDTPGNSSQYAVFGLVSTSLLSVNVKWMFVLNSAAKIISVEVKLMADLKELLTLNRRRNSSTN